MWSKFQAFYSEAVDVVRSAMGAHYSQFLSALRNGDAEIALDLYSKKKSIRDTLSIKPNDPLGAEHKGNTVLHYTARLNMKDVYNQLLASGGKPDFKNDDRMNCLHLICIGPCEDQTVKEDMLRTTIDYGLVGMHVRHVLSEGDNDGNTVLHLAASAGLSGCVDLLMEKEADLSATNNLKKTPADLATEANHIDIATRLETKILFHGDGPVTSLEPDPETLKEIASGPMGMKDNDLRSMKDQLLIETSHMLGVSLFTADVLLRNHSMSHTHTPPHTYIHFSGDFQHCFSLNSTSNNNSMLSHCYPDQQQLQMLNNVSDSQSLPSYSSGIIQQSSNQLNISHDLTISTQSDSNSMNVSGSQAVQEGGVCAPLYPIQQDVQTMIDSISNGLLSQNHLPLNTASPDSIQPPDLISVTPSHNSSFTMQQHQANLLQDQQNVSSVNQFMYSDLTTDSELSDQYSIGFNGNSLSGLDGGLGMLSSPTYPMQQLTSPGLGMYPPSPSYLDIQQARQLLYENTQQMKRILRSYQSLQNTLLRVTARNHTMLPPTSPFDRFMDSRLMMTQQHPGHMIQQQSSVGDHMLQVQDHMMQGQRESNQMHDHMLHQQQSESSHMTNLQDHVQCPQPDDSDHVTQMQDHMTQHQPIANNLMGDPQQNDSNHMTTMQDHMIHHQTNDINQFLQTSDHVMNFSDADHLTQLQEQVVQQSHDMNTPQLVDHMTHQRPPSSSCSTEPFQNSDTIDPPSLLLCEPSELLTPVGTQADDVDLPPPEKRARLDNCSSFDIGIQCDLGPETIAALAEEEMEQEVCDAESVDTIPEETTEDSPSIPKLSEQPKLDRIVNKYPCEVKECSKAYVHRKDLTRHMKIRHGVLPKTLKPVAMETAEKPFVCTVPACGRSYFHMRDLRRHQRACHRVNSQIETVDQSNSDAEQTYKGNDLIHKLQLRYPCDYQGCVRSYVHRKDLVRHKRLYHKDASAKPTVPIPIPYSDTDLKLIRQEVKLEVEQLMKKMKKESGSSTISTSNTGTETPNSSTVLSPDLILSSFDTTGVLASLGVAVTSEQIDEELSEVPVSSSAAHLISLIQTLSTPTPSTSALTEIPNFSLPIDLPVIPVVANTVSSLSEKNVNVSSCGGLKEVLSVPSKNLLEAPCSVASRGGSQGNTNNSCTITKSQTVPLLKDQLKDTRAEVACSIQPSDIDSLLEFSTQELVASSLKEQTSKDAPPQRSPEPLSSLAAAALSMSESELSGILMRTVSCSSDLTTPFSCTLPGIVINSNDSSCPKQSNGEDLLGSLEKLTDNFSSPKLAQDSDELVKEVRLVAATHGNPCNVMPKQTLTVDSTFSSSQRPEERNETILANMDDDSEVCSATPTSNTESLTSDSTTVSSLVNHGQNLLCSRIS